MSDKNFQPDAIFNRFSELKKVKINDEIFNVSVHDNLVRVEGEFSHFIAKSNVYERWVLIDGVLHYIQRINHWMGGIKCNYVNAEV